MKKIIALLILAVSMAAAQTVVTGNGVTGAQGSGNVSPSADNSSDLGAVGTRWRSLFLGTYLAWTNGSGTADTTVARVSAGVIDVGVGGDNSGSVQALGFFVGNGQYGYFGPDQVNLRSTGAIGFVASANATDSRDVAISRKSPAVLAVGNGTAGDFSGTIQSATDLIVTANGASWTQTCSSELLTIAAAATTDTVGNLLPANSIIKTVMVRVVTVIPTAATFTVGDATIAARFATGVAVAANTTAIGLTQVDQTGTSGPKQTAAAKLRITPNLTPGTATGQVRVSVCADTFVAPTS